ncbi:hypothetical protein VPNG_02891 [Cytospora leucostoma]|uniref:Uncharacterized protein n=1 Tax=Cytospora leucostoma TaxID=1230097 RepID=A0A423XJB2_9PEZI|nr:hypothetical protein VPNG_02891 [Cytospora leucostoma]
MAPFFARRASQPLVITGQTGMGMDNPASHLDSLLGDRGSTDPDAVSYQQHHHHPDPDDLESLRSSRSPHSVVQQDTQPNKLQRRRNQYSYMTATTTPGPSTSSPQAAAAAASPSPSHSPEGGISRSRSTRAQLLTQQDDDYQPHQRSRSYTLPAGPSWLVNNPLVEVRRQSSVRGEKRETRKLQKEHPTGSSRPSMSLEIEGRDRGSSGLGVRKKMGRLRELYRK